MLAMHRDGLIALPAPQGRQTGPGRSSSGRTPKRRCSRPRRPSTRSARSTCAPSCAAPARASSGTSSSPATISRIKTLVGAQMRYAVHDRDGWPLCSLLHRKLAPRDNFIGWTRQLREKNLPFVVDPEIPDPALDQYPQPVRTSWPSSAARLDRALPVLSPSSMAPFTGPPAGPASGPPRGAGATTGTGSPTSLKRMSGSGPCDGIGNAPSIAKIGRGEWKRPR